MSRGHRRGKPLIVVIVVLLIVWPAYQIYAFLTPGAQKADAQRMLYEVSLFQMGIVNSSLNESVHSRVTKELDSLKLAVYSAAYTHERLVKTVGGGRLQSLSSLNKMVEFITALQIGGDRPVSDQERQTLLTFQRQFGDMLGAYGQLFSSGGQVVASKNNTLTKTDAELAKLLDEQLSP